MTTMLLRILTHIRNTDGTVTLGELARRMNTPASALAPMIQTLEAAGLLGDQPGTALPCATGCGSSCDPSACPLTVSLPILLGERRT